MSFIEFNYMVLQSYDFVELARRHGCPADGRLGPVGQHRQRRGARRRMGTHQLYALTTPLLTTASGAKMGKTAQGAVWLNADQFSPYDFWQYWRNTEDADVGRFLKLFTTLPIDEIARLESARRLGDQRGEEGAGDRGDGDACMAAPLPTRQPKRRARPSRRARPPRRCRRSRWIEDRAGRRRRHPVAVCHGRACGIQWRGAPACPGRRGAHQRSPSADDRRVVASANSTTTVASSCRSARRSTCWLDQLSYPSPELEDRAENSWRDHRQRIDLQLPANRRRLRA